MLTSQPWRPGIGSLIVFIHGMLAVAAWKTGQDLAPSTSHRQPTLQVHLLPGVAGRLPPLPHMLPDVPSAAAPVWQPLTVPTVQLATPVVHAAAAESKAGTATVTVVTEAAPAQTPATPVAPLLMRAPPTPNPATKPPDFTPVLRAAHADHRYCPPASYPPALRERGIEGDVMLRVRVDKQGQAADVQLLSGSGFRLFDEAALRQVRSCRFQPAMRGDAALESWVEFPIRFALQAG